MPTLYIDGLCVDNSKSAIVKSWNIVIRKSTKVPIIDLRDTIAYLLERNVIHFRYSFEQHQTCP